MKVLLDENFPLGLHRALHADGIAADHVITLGWRGVSDRELRERVRGEDVLFLTQDTEFLMADTEPFTLVVVSRVRQARMLADQSPSAIVRFGSCWTRRTPNTFSKPMTVSCCPGKMSPRPERNTNRDSASSA